MKPFGNYWVVISTSNLIATLRITDKIAAAMIMIMIRRLWCMLECLSLSLKVTYVKCSEKASGVLFADGKNSRRLSSTLPRLRIDIRSSRLLSTKYTLKKSVMNERTSPLATRLSLRSGWNTVSGGSPDNFWENARAVKIASFFLSFSSKSSNDCKNLRITFSRFFIRNGFLRRIFCI